NLQNLVDDDLEEQWRDEPKNLQKERGNHHLAENPAVAVHRGGEPTQIEDGGQAGERGAPAKQYQATRPGRGEVVAFDGPAARLERLLDEQLAVDHPAGDEEGARVGFGDRRQ